MSTEEDQQETIAVALTLIGIALILACIGQFVPYASMPGFDEGVEYSFSVWEGWGWPRIAPFALTGTLLVMAFRPTFPFMVSLSWVFVIVHTIVIAIVLGCAVLLEPHLALSLVMAKESGEDALSYSTYVERQAAIELILSVPAAVDEIMEKFDRNGFVLCCQLTGCCFYWCAFAAIREEALAVRNGEDLEQ